MSFIDMPKDGYDGLSGESPWILDSGASNHMTGELKLLYDIFYEFCIL